MRIDKGCGALDDLDPVALQLVGDDGHFRLDDLIFSCHQVGKGDPACELGTQLGKPPPCNSVEVLDGVLEGLAR